MRQNSQLKSNSVSALTNTEQSRRDPWSGRVVAKRPCMERPRRPEREVGERNRRIRAIGDPQHSTGKSASPAPPLVAPPQHRAHMNAIEPGALHIEDACISTVATQLWGSLQ